MARQFDEAKPKKADYILYFKPGVPIAVIEAKDNNPSAGAGMQQAREYAEILDVPFAYSCNGDAFLEHDRTGSSTAVEREVALDQFTTPPTQRATTRRRRQSRGRTTTTTAQARRH